MKKLSHVHLVKLHEVIDSPADDKMFLVLDLIRGGQVMDWDNKSFSYRSSRTPTGVLGRAAVRACLRDVVVALDYCGLRMLSSYLSCPSLIITGVCLLMCSSAPQPHLPSRHQAREHPALERRGGL